MEGDKIGLYNIIKSFLIYLAESEKRLNTQRISLQKFYNFTNPTGYFKYLDKNCKNYIDFSDISSFFPLILFLVMVLSIRFKTSLFALNCLKSSKISK